MCFDSGKKKVSLVLRSFTFWKNVVQAFSWNGFYGLDIECNRTHQRTRWMLIQMLTIIFAVQTLGNNIIFRIDRIKEEQRCRLVFFTLNRLSDAFTTLFLNMRPLDRTVRLNVYYGVLDPRLFLNTFDRKRLGVTWPDFSCHARRLSYTFELPARQFQVVELPRRFFSSCWKVLKYILQIYVR